MASSTTTRTSPDLPAAEIVERITDEAIAVMRSLIKAPQRHVQKEIESVWVFHHQEVPDTGHDQDVRNAVAE